MYSATMSKAAVPNFTGWVFVLMFVATYVVLYLGYSVVPDAVLRDSVYYYGIVCPSKMMINWLAPSEHVIGVQNNLISATAKLSVVRGCDGSGIILLLVAAIIAYRANLKATLLGSLGAIALVYALNQLRIVALYFVNVHEPAWFMPIHVYFIPTLMILVGALYFAIWAAHQHGIKRSAKN
jgi:exosortase family protein XrtM